MGAGLGLGTLFTKSIRAAAGLEKTSVAFETMLGNADKADTLIRDLRGFSDATPFEPEEVIKAGRGLLAFGTSSEQVVPTLRTLGDVAAGLQIPLGELTEIYGKARAQGRLFQEDINQLAGRGIPIYGELAKVLGVAESEVRGLVSEGKVGFPELQKVFQNLTKDGGQFAGLMERQSETTA
ncbi:MAG: tape measure protein, partial [Phycisphaeraceae bacterium]|nr:tape measure protein [Phycisphaeraceae bacterium]